MIDAAAAFISAMLFGLLIFKIGQHIFPGELDRFGLVQNIYNKFVWFLSEPIANALSLYAVPSNTVLQFSVILILIVGSLFFIRAHGPVDGALMIFLAATCVLCSYSPNLATAENWASYRSIGALSASVVALVVFMVSEIYSYYERKYSSISLVKKFNKYKWVASAILLIILATYVQGNVLNGFVLPNVTELNNLVSFLSEAKGQGSKKVALTIKRSSWSDSASGKMAYDEFGLHSSITDCYAKAIVEIVLHSTNLIPDAIIVPSEGVITDQQSDHYTNIVVDFSHLITSQRFKTSSPKHSVIGLLQKNNIIASANSLSFYSAKGDLATVKLLINAGIDVNAQTSGGSYALIEASWAGKQDVVSYLLDAKADVNSASNQITPLSAAIIQKHELIALLLLEHGANPNVVDSIGSTPLMECSWQGNVLLVNALLSKGASPNYRRSSDGMTATKFALAAKKEDVVKILKAAGASE